MFSTIDRRQMLRLSGAGLISICHSSRSFGGPPETLAQIKSKNTHLSFRRRGDGHFSILNNSGGQFAIDTTSIFDSRKVTFRDIPGRRNCQDAYVASCEFEDVVSADFSQILTAPTPANDGQISYAGWLNHVSDSLAVWTGRDCDGKTQDSEANASYVASNTIKIDADEPRSIAFFFQYEGKHYVGDEPKYTLKLVDGVTGEVIYVEPVTRRKRTFFLPVTELFPFRARACRAEVQVDLHQIKNGASADGAVVSGNFSHGFLFEYERTCK